MTAEDQTIAARMGGLLVRRGGRAGRLLVEARRRRWQRRVHPAALAADLARLREEVERTRERQEEQIERLEDLAQELVLSVEALRRAHSAESRDR
jgi:hypothetical protein